MADKQLAFCSFDHEFIFRRHPQSRQRTEANIKEENDSWKMHRIHILGKRVKGKLRQE